MNLRIIFILCLVAVCLIRVLLECGLSFTSCMPADKPYFEIGKSGDMVEDIRIGVSDKVREFLPSPHSELVLGLVLGVDNLYRIPGFKRALKNTGTIHVVVVSGYNVALVFMAVSGAGAVYTKRRLVSAQLISFFYSLISGFEPPVVRSWLMLAIFSWGKHYGRRISGTWILVVTAVFMVGIKPSYLFSLSFQLSFLATLGLVLYSTSVTKLIYRLFKFRNVIVDDLGTTIAAQILVWPLISYKFGSVSVISPVVNMFVLWTIPVSTIIGFIFVVLIFIHPFVGNIMTLLLYPFLDIFVSIVNLFDKVPLGSVIFEMSIWSLLVYYLIVFFLSYLFFRRKKCLATEGM